MIYQINSGQRNVRMLHRGIKAGLTSAEWANVIGVHWRRDEETHNRHSSIFLADLVRLSVQINGPIMSLLNWVKFVSQCLVYRMHNIRIEEKLRLFHIVLKTHRQQSKEGFQCYLIILDCLFFPRNECKQGSGGIQLPRTYSSIDSRKDKLIDMRY